MATKIAKPMNTKGTPPPAEMPPQQTKKVNNLTKRPSDEMVALNFSVPVEFRTRFKIFAAMHNMTQVQVLYAAFEDFENSFS